jgi:hypothetical protein
MAVIFLTSIVSYSNPHRTKNYLIKNHLHLDQKQFHQNHLIKNHLIKKIWCNSQTSIFYVLSKVLLLIILSVIILSSFHCLSFILKKKWIVPKIEKQKVFSSWSKLCCFPIHNGLFLFLFLFLFLLCFCFVYVLFLFLFPYTYQVRSPYLYSILILVLCIYILFGGDDWYLIEKTLYER